MLTKLSLKHYKAFENASVNIRPITILLGANSVGKSSIIQLFLMLQQTGRAGLKSYKSALKLYGGYVNLGDAGNLFRKKDTSKPFTMSFTVTNIMKKTIILIILLTSLISNAQCPAPSNLVYTAINGNDALLSWTENGNAASWDVTVVPDFYVGDPLPTDSYYVSNTNPFTFVSFPPTGCNVFFVRSRCSTTDVSPWVALPTSGCDPNVFNYIATLSNNNFSIDDNNIKISPNPSKNVVQVKSNSIIDKITIFDSLGKIILIQTQNNNEINIEKLLKGIYLIEIISENEKNYRKLIKE